jgi:hypothetical protein
MIEADAPPQCWSYSRDTLERCAKPAGHDDEHEVVRYTRWDDEGAWSPDDMFKVTLLKEGSNLDNIPAGPFAALDVDQGPTEEGGCYNCRHPEHEGPCMVLVTGQQIECGCTFRSI